MRITRVTDEDRKLTRVSQAVAEAIESGQGITLQKVGSRDPITSLRPSAPKEAPVDNLQSLIAEKDSLWMAIQANGSNPGFDSGAAYRRFAQLQQLIALRQQEPRRTDRGGRLQ